jgi:biotin-[acetyl-CoA-carboxylase] ligase BirA-like protein
VQLGTIARAGGVRLLSLDEIDSTNDEARRLIETGERGPLWIVAARQTKGRGRLGRQWMSPPGNFYASFIFGDCAEVRIAPELGFVAGVAAMRALRACVGQRPFRLKWPNDLLLEGEKLGGILLECVNAASAPVAIIGLGVNIVEAPSDLPYPARALSSIGPGAPSREAFFERLSDAMSQALELWRGGESFQRIREEWLGSAAGLGQDIRVVLSNETIEGRFETIDASGRLAIETSGGLRIVEAGDVLIGPRATTGAPA